jgi:hypothetical protein
VSNLIFRFAMLLGVLFQLFACDSDEETDTPIDPAISRFPLIMAEDKLTMPKHLTQVERYTDISLTLKMNFDFISKLKVDETIHFDVLKSTYWLIQHDKIEVVDSIGQRHALRLYLVPQSRAKLDFTLGGFTTLNDIAYNPITLNLSHTAFSMRGSMLENITGQYTESITSKAHNAARYQKSKHIAASKWMAVTLLKDHVDPSTSIYPCYGYYDGKNCLKINPNDIKNTNIQFHQYAYFQPIAPVGYKNFDWRSHSFVHPLLKDLSKSPPKEPSLEAQDYAREEAKRMLKTQSETMVDIGWYGLPVAHRNRIKRFHVTRVYFDLIDDRSIYDKKIILPKNSIQVRHYDVESPVEFQQVTHDAIEVTKHKL